MLVGRVAERCALETLLEAARAGRGGTLVLRGEPGIGKTRLLESARELASGMQVLSARGVESESDLAFAGLHQLVRPALELLGRLPEPQARALEGALGMASRRGDARFLVSVACLGLLSEYAESEPVLCLVDDAHWLDTPSADALLFVARRLRTERIAIVLAAREGDARTFAMRELPALDLRGLDATAAAEILEAHAEGRVAAPVRELLVDRAAGNALALVELSSALTPAQLAGEEPVHGSLPLGRDVERLFLERVRELPESTQRLLLVVAADDTGRLATVMRAAGALGIPGDSLAAAERASVVSVRGDSVDMRHPLVRSAVYQAAPSDDRRAAHTALADALDREGDAERRAWHRASAALGPDDEVAGELEATAVHARLRSGHAAAAAALQRAAELSADDEARGRRLVAAASAAWDAGQPERATRLADAALPLVGDPRIRAELDHIRGEVGFRCGVLADAYETLVAGAERIADIDSYKALEMLFDAANAAVTIGDYARVAETARSAARLRVHDERERVLVGLLTGVGSLQGGESADELPRLAEAVSHAEDFDEPRWLVWASGGAQILGDQAAAADLLRRAVALARTSARRERLAPALASFVLDGVVEGRFAVVSEAEEGLALTTEAGLRNLAASFHASLAWLAAVRGEADVCRAQAAQAAELSHASGATVAPSVADWALSLLDLVEGRPKDVVTRFEAAGAGHHPYIALLSTPDVVEACVRTGRHEQARTAFAGLERFARPDAPSWALALAARCRGLLAPRDDAERELAEALRRHGDSTRPFDRARTALVLGELLRRERRRLDAREHLRSALDLFEGIGAEPWANRARAELRATGETARKRDPSTLDRLTPQELQIARFVARGLSNKEVAAQLFLSPRTVDYHLRRVFVKLEITSRVQLAHLALGEDSSERAAATPPARAPA
jgi:DNA-binding CsgD family transcriptional regulator